MSFLCNERRSTIICPSIVRKLESNLSFDAGGNSTRTSKIMINFISDKLSAL